MESFSHQRYCCKRLYHCGGLFGSDVFFWASIHFDRKSAVNGCEFMENAGPWWLTWISQNPYKPSWACIFHFSTYFSDALCKLVIFSNACNYFSISIHSAVLWFSPVVYFAKKLFCFLTKKENNFVTLVYSRILTLLSGTILFVILSFLCFILSRSFKSSFFR